LFSDFTTAVHEVQRDRDWTAMSIDRQGAFGKPLELHTMPGSAYYGKLVQHRVAGPFYVTESIFPGGSSLLEHYHEIPYFTFTLSGSYCERYGMRSRFCTPGTAVAHPAFELHSQEFLGDPAVLLRIALNVNETEDAAEAAFKAPMCVNDPSIARAVSRTHCELAASDACSDTILEDLAYELVARMLLSTCRTTGSRRRALCARTFIRSSLYKRMPLAAIANEMGVSRATLYRDFKSAFGCGPGDYLRQARVEACTAMLRRGSRLITEIATECGFYDQSHFDRCFRVAMGVSPSEYRRRLR
jgi:AraC-like DNA-binding protein